MQNDAKLLPCPFCGGSADISHDHTVEENHAYGCRACGFWFDTFNSDDPIAAWNTRTPHPAPVTAREAEPVAWAAYDDSLPVDVDLRQDIADQWCADGIEVRPLYAHPPQPSETVAEAAEIERLTKAHDTVCGALAEAISRAEKAEAENQRLREALKPFANAASSIERVCGPRDPDDAIEVQFDALDAALSSTGEKG